MNKNKVRSGQRAWLFFCVLFNSSQEILSQRPEENTSVHTLLSWSRIQTKVFIIAMGGGRVDSVLARKWKKKVTANKELPFHMIIYGNKSKLHPIKQRQ